MIRVRNDFCVFLVGIVFFTDEIRTSSVKLHGSTAVASVFLGFCFAVERNPEPESHAWKGVAFWRMDKTLTRVAVTGIPKPGPRQQLT